MEGEDQVKIDYWDIGSYVWAPMHEGTLWPCVVTDNGESQLCDGSSTEKHQTQVSGFGSNVTCWVNSDSIYIFGGKSQWEKMARSNKDGTIKTVTLNQETTFQVPIRLQDAWNWAVKKAGEELFEMDDDDAYIYLSPDETRQLLAQNERISKRQINESKPASSAASEMTVKNKRSSATCLLGTEKKKNRTTSSDDDLRQTDLKKQKEMQKLRDKYQPPNCEVYVSRTKDVYKELHPDVDMEAIENELRYQWETMPLQERYKYRSKYYVPGHDK